MAKKKAKVKARTQDIHSLANEMYRLLIRCGMYFDGDDSQDPDVLRDECASIVRDMDSYYVHTDKGRN